MKATYGRLVVVLGLLLVAAVLPALPGTAAAGSPGLWSGMDGERFVVRPQAVAISLTGHTGLGRLGDGRGGITWRSWTGARATGVGTVWINDGIPSYGQGTFHRHRASIKAWRVRGGHFTRLSVRFRGGTTEWKPGKVRYTWRYELAPLGSGFAWD